MVRFIVGKADMNISAAVRGELAAALEKNGGKRRMIFIVPDQFEYETEKAVYRLLNEKELLKRFYEIKITTFTRLCAEILEECGEHRPFADDIVKNIIMHRTVSENKTALSALNKVASRPGFCGRMVKTVSALKTSGITARDLELSLNALELTDKKLADGQPVIRKLAETNMLYTNYEGLISGYVDKLDVTGMAADLVAKGKSAAFGGTDVFVDCFNDFTHSQRYFLECVITAAENVTFGFTAELDSPCDVFATANEHISILKQTALENDIDVEFVTSGIESRFPENSPLAGASRHLFQNAKHREPLGTSCELVTAADVYEELDYAAAKIKRLTIDGGMRCNEIAVLCTDVGSYGKYVESVFRKYDIPIFLDTPEPILYQPLINMVIAVLNALNDFSVDTVLSCVKTKFFSKPKYGEEADDDIPEEEDNETEDAEQLSFIDMPWEKGTGYTTLSDKDIDEFEHYLYEWDLKTSHLKKEFTFEDKHGKNDSRKQGAEQVRRSVAVPLLELRKRLRKNGSTVNGAEMTELLYDFLVNTVGMRRAIFKRCKNEQNTALDADKVALYQRLWNSLIDIFNKLHEQLSDVNVTIGEYRDIFREICTVTKLAVPPQFIDCVLVGDIDRTRADNIRAAFIVGASYEAFPTPASEAGIFSQYEMELIHDKLIHLDNGEEDVSRYIEVLTSVGENSRREYCLKSAKEQYHLSLYRAYRAMTLPTEYLCLSCPETDSSGEALVRSDVFGELMTTFNGMEMIDAAAMGNSFYCRTPKAAKLRYAMGLNSPSKENAILRSVLEAEDGEFVKALDEIREARRDIAYDRSGGYFSGKHTLSPTTAQLLFPNSMGATSLEKLNKCKFNYFCEYGLRIEERNKRSFTRSKRGEAIHFVFQKILEEYCADMDAFFALTRGGLLALSKKYLALYRESETNNDAAEDKRTEYLFNNIANSAADVLITMQTELFARRYRPKFFELNIKSDPDNECHAVINNERSTTAEPPAVQIFGGDEKSPSPPKPSATDENAPYLITRPLEIPLENGSVVTVQGIIDRVDMFGIACENGKPAAYIRVVDYKSSAHTFDLQNAQNGINIQMLLYLFALQTANENNPTLELRPGGVSYIPSNNLGASEEQLSPYRLLAMNYHESGLFIRDDVTESDLENYKQTIFGKFESDSTIDPKVLEKIKSSYEPKVQNLAEAELFNELRLDVMRKITENLDAVFGGTVDALPTTYYEAAIKPDGSESSKYRDPCEYCRFKDICGNAGKNANKIEKTRLRPKTVKKDDTRTFWENRYIKGKEADGNGK